jgi:hypothetical protein
MPGILRQSLAAAKFCLGGTTSARQVATAVMTASTPTSRTQTAPEEAANQPGVKEEETAPGGPLDGTVVG